MLGRVNVKVLDLGLACSWAGQYTSSPILKPPWESSLAEHWLAHPMLQPARGRASSSTLMPSCRFIPTQQGQLCCPVEVWAALPSTTPSKGLCQLSCSHALGLAYMWPLATKDSSTVLTRRACWVLLGDSSPALMTLGASSPIFHRWWGGGGHLSLATAPHIRQVARPALPHLHPRTSSLTTPQQPGPALLCSLGEMWGPFSWVLQLETMDIRLAFGGNRPLLLQVHELRHGPGWQHGPGPHHNPRWHHQPPSSGCSSHSQQFYLPSLYKHPSPSLSLHHYLLIIIMMPGASVFLVSSQECYVPPIHWTWIA
jgi:hypothetical protein